MATVYQQKAKVKESADTGDPWMDKLRADFRNPVRVAFASVVLIGFIVFVVRFVAGG